MFLTQVLVTFAPIVRVAGESVINQKDLPATARWRLTGVVLRSGLGASMVFFRRNSRRDIRPLVPIAKQPPPVSLASLQSSAFYAEVLQYFRDYPATSLMSGDCRCVLFSLIRILRPKDIAEIGTYHAGTTEVMARAAWENKQGTLHTTDPFGGERCPPIIAGWPKELQKHVSFHPLNSMDFLSHLMRRRISLDMTLIDGNHDYEFALFDLQLVARMTRPSGIVVMDNAEQSGPFHAARTFLSYNPTWCELGSTMADHDPSRPFDATRASMPGTSFVVLQAPPHLVVGEFSSSGQIDTDIPRVSGLALVLTEQTTAGTLHYQAILRRFEEGSVPVEVKAIGRIRIDVADTTRLTHKFDTALHLEEGGHYTFEIDMSWQPDADCPPLALTSTPELLAA